MDDGRTLCDCGIPVGGCSMHGDLVTRRIAERLNSRPFSYQTGKYHVTVCAPVYPTTTSLAMPRLLQELSKMLTRWRQVIIGNSSICVQVGFMSRAVTQIAVALQNKPGTLAKLCSTLRDPQKQPSFWQCLMWLRLSVSPADRCLDKSARSISSPGGLVRIHITSEMTVQLAALA